MRGKDKERQRQVSRCPRNIHFLTTPVDIQRTTGIELKVTVVFAVY